VGGYKVAIIGAGHLGTLLADRIPATCRKVIISHHKADAVALADEVGGLASDQMSAVRGCPVIFLAVPGPVAAQVLPEFAPHLDDNALVVNMAADVMTDELADTFPQVRFAAVKVIGHAREMALGSPGVIVLDHVSDEDEALLRELVDGLGPVIRDDESKVVVANAAVAEVMGKAASELRDRLSALGLDAELINAAITTTGPGVLRSLVEAAPGQSRSE
jgi:pyrroline-5-carboxylate reductase